MILHVRDTLRLLYPLRVLLLGLFIAQIIGTLLVYASNHALARKLVAVHTAGYGPLPGTNLDPALTSWAAAIAGGVFFTLSIGAGIVLLCLGAVLLMEAFTGKAGRAIVIVVLGIFWLSVLLWANANGLNYGLSVFLVVLPPPVLAAALAWSPRRVYSRQLPWRRTIHLLLVVALTLWWFVRIDPDIFVNIKDNLMLTTRPGIKAVHLYYRYNLYAAEAFKSLQQKQVKTCALENFTNAIERQRMADSLLAHGYFAIPATPADTVDMACRKDGNRLIFSRQGREVISVSAREWRHTAGEIFEKISARTDTGRPFRRITFYLLVCVSPLALYLAVFTGFALLPGLLLDLRLSSWLVPTLCCLSLTVVVFYMDNPPADKMDHVATEQAITSGSRRETLAALRFIYRNGLDIQDFDGYQHLAENDDFALSYWLLNNYSNSRHPSAASRIIDALDSPSPYMVCRAMESLRQKTGTIAPAEINRLLLRQLTTSRNWYVQLYAYKLLRELGWRPLTTT